VLRRLKDAIPPWGPDFRVLPSDALPRIRIAGALSKARSPGWGTQTGVIRLCRQIKIYYI